MIVLEMKAVIKSCQKYCRILAQEYQFATVEIHQFYRQAEKSLNRLNQCQ